MTGIRLLTALLPLVLIAPGVYAGDKKEEPKQKSILGWVEYVELQPWGFRTKAKLDTGAKTSSIHAENIERFERKDKEWARFEFVFREEKDSKPRRVKIEAPIVRNVYIKRHKHKTQSRPVVMLKLCIDNQSYKTQFSLIDRSRFIYPILIGRRLLKEAAIVDAGNTFLGSEHCKIADNKKKSDDDDE